MKTFQTPLKVLTPYEPHIVNAWGFFFNFDTITIRKDSEGRYCLNDLHKVAGGAEKDEPNRYARTDGFRNLIAAIRNEYESNPAKNGGKDWVTPCMTAGGRNGGTYVCEELVYAYAMWISPSFHLKVIQVFKEYATKAW